MATEVRLEEEIVRLVRQEVGGSDPTLVKAVTDEVLRAVVGRSSQTEGSGNGGGAERVLTLADCVHCRANAQPDNQNRGVVTVTGINVSGVVARFATLIAEFNADIQDISQTIVGGFFTMIIIVDLSRLQKRHMTFNELRQRLLGLGKELGVEVVAVHEEIFRGMQRI